MILDIRYYMYIIKIIIFLFPTISDSYNISTIKDKNNWIITLYLGYKAMLKMRIPLTNIKLLFIKKFNDLNKIKC